MTNTIDNAKIKFSHVYNKFGDEIPRNVKLLHVFIEETKNLSKEFIEYDTLYFDGKGKQNYYPLPGGKILVLLLKKEGENETFTTIRRWIPKKEEYYRSMIGQTFQIIITGEGE